MITDITLNTTKNLKMSLDSIQLIDIKDYFGSIGRPKFQQTIYGQDVIEKQLSSLGGGIGLICFFRLSANVLFKTPLTNQWCAKVIG